MTGLALVDRVRRLPPARRAQLFDQLGAVPGKLSDVRHDWPGFWARPEQLFDPGVVDRYSLILVTGARREGKTRTVVELFVEEVDSGRATAPRLFAATVADVDKAAVHGRAGILRHLNPDQRKRWRWVKDEGPAGTIRVRTRIGTDVEIVCFTTKAPEGAVSHAGDLGFVRRRGEVGAARPNGVGSRAHLL